MEVNIFPDNPTMTDKTKGYPTAGLTFSATVSGPWHVAELTNVLAGPSAFN